MQRKHDRMPTIPDQSMNEAQRAAARELRAGRRGGVVGPFIPLLRSPELLNRAQRLGEYVRYDSHLEPRISELVILMTARYWTQQFEWHAHHDIAVSAGVDAHALAAIAAGRRPSDLPEDQSAAYEAVDELFRTKTLSDKTYSRATATFGEAGLIDLIGIVGYYTLLAMAMNVAQTALPTGVDPPLLSLP
jgi:4-carboxymuconolactone decarboxylase